MTERNSNDDAPTSRERTLVLAVAFGVASVPWTYAFVAGNVPLWPSFVAAATFYAVGGGTDGFRRGTASNLVGVLYATATLAIVAGVGGGPLVLAAVVGAFMFLASLHARLPPLSFTPGGFLGYATLFGVHAGGSSIVTGGLAGEAVVTGGAMVIGAVIGYVVERIAERASSSRAVGR